MINKIQHLFNRYDHRLLIGAILFGFSFVIFFLHLSLSHLSAKNQDEKEESLPDEVVDLAYVEDHLLYLDQTNNGLIQYTRFKYLTPPSKLAYILQGHGNTTGKLSEWVADFFGNKTGGTFVEAGAHEGEIQSHTLYMEKMLGWSGLLVECNPTVVPYLKSHNRKAWIASVCLAPSKTPGLLKFPNPADWKYSGTFKEPWNLTDATKWTFFTVNTIPLYTILASLGWTEVDYFRLAIEGMELAVLKTFPFDLVIFKVLIIEVSSYTVKEKEELDCLLTNNEYYFVKDMQEDKIYIHNSVKYLLKELALQQKISTLTTEPVDY